MCRSIKNLRLLDGPATREEIEASALQYVRKVSGYRKPSQVNAEAFDTAVREISNITEEMLGTLRSAGRRTQTG